MNNIDQRIDRLSTALTNQPYKNSRLDEWSSFISRPEHTSSGSSIERERPYKAPPPITMGPLVTSSHTKTDNNTSNHNNKQANPTSQGNIANKPQRSRDNGQLPPPSPKTILRTMTSPLTPLLSPIFTSSIEMEPNYERYQHNNQQVEEDAEQNNSNVDMRSDQDETISQMRTSDKSGDSSNENISKRRKLEEPNAISHNDNSNPTSPSEAQSHAANDSKEAVLAGATNEPKAHNLNRVQFTPESTEDSSCERTYPAFVITHKSRSREEVVKLFEMLSQRELRLEIEQDKLLAAQLLVEATRPAPQLLDEPVKSSSGLNSAQQETSSSNAASSSTKQKNSESTMKPPSQPNIKKELVEELPKSKDERKTGASKEKSVSPESSKTISVKSDRSNAPKKEADKEKPIKKEKIEDNGSAVNKKREEKKTEDKKESKKSSSSSSSSTKKEVKEAKKGKEEGLKKEKERSSSSSSRKEEKKSSKEKSKESSKEREKSSSRSEKESSKEKSREKERSREKRSRDEEKHSKRKRSHDSSGEESNDKRKRTDNSDHSSRSSSDFSPPQSNPQQVLSSDEWRREAIRLKHAADKLDKIGQKHEAAELYIQSSLKFLRCGHVLETQHSMKQAEVMYQETAHFLEGISKFCIERNKKMASLCYKLLAVALTKRFSISSDRLRSIKEDCLQIEQMQKQQSSNTSSSHSSHPGLGNVISVVPHAGTPPIQSPSQPSPTTVSGTPPGLNISPQLNTASSTVNITSGPNSPDRVVTPTASNAHHSVNNLHLKPSFSRDVSDMVRAFEAWHKSELFAEKSEGSSGNLALYGLDIPTLVEHVLKELY